MVINLNMFTKQINNKLRNKMLNCEEEYEREK